MLAPTERMSLLKISHENTFPNTRGIRLHAIVATNIGLEQTLAEKTIIKNYFLENTFCSMNSKY